MLPPKAERKRTLQMQYAPQTGIDPPKLTRMPLSTQLCSM